MSSQATPAIGIILCSSRQPRVCTQIAAFVTESIELQRSLLQTESDISTEAAFHIIDLAARNLPFLDEPNIPSQIHHHSEYSHQHTRDWSQEVQKYNAFIFILPQYNWGYPAVVKNAIDYLYHEWHDKPALIVSYGGHGGTKSAAQLHQVLQGVHMKVVETMPALTFPSRQTLVQASKGDDIRALGEGGIWDAERGNVLRAFGELMALVSK